MTCLYFITHILMRLFFFFGFGGKLYAPPPSPPHQTTYNICTMYYFRLIYLLQLRVKFNRITPTYPIFFATKYYVNKLGDRRVDFDDPNKFTIGP